MKPDPSKYAHLTESSRDVAIAMDTIMEIMEEHGPDALVDPRKLVIQASGGSKIGSYQSALQVLLGRGMLFQAKNWTVKLGKNYASRES